jgi:hypothetical protein
VGLAEPIASHASVAAWATGLSRQWGGDPLAEDPDKLAALAAFCEFLGQNPDELLAFCFLRRRATGERFASKQRREVVNEKLKQFVAASGLKGVEARRRRNHIISFLSHNGVLI